MVDVRVIGLKLHYGVSSFFSDILLSFSFRPC